MKYLIVGLGNIGTEYHETRHNIGFMICDALVEKEEYKSEKLGSLALVKFKGRSIYTLKPNTYMNLSGKAVRYWQEKLKVPTENILVMTDDVNLPFGKIRIRKKGSSGGHNGLQNIQDLLNTNGYPRLRFGVGGDYHKGQQVDYVLGKFSDVEQKEMPELLNKCVQAIKSFSTIGLDRTMNQFNG